MHIKSGKIEFGTFSEFEKWLEELYENHATIKKNRPELKYYPPLFRGHASSTWDLSTSLERTGCIKYPVSKYFRAIHGIAMEICSYTGKQWGIDWKFIDKINSKISSFDLLPINELYLFYDLMIYLRHHGYPSPLLDWSRSPYVATYFAFDDLKKSAEGQTLKASIYCYIETMSGTKNGSDSNGMIWGIGPNFAAHKRHSLQQCQYTICYKKTENDFIFGGYEEAINHNNEDQDILIKIDLPILEKSHVLRKLNLMNINAHSLFANDDGLVRYLAYKSLIIDS